MNKKYYASILKLITESEYNDYENQVIDKWVESFEVGSYKTVQGVQVDSVEEVKEMIARKKNPSLYIYTIREIPSEDE